MTSAQQSSPQPAADLFDAPITVGAPQDPLQWFAWRLAQHGVQVSERTVPGIRAAILEAGIGLALCGRNPAGKPEGYEDRFERVFGEALSQPVSRGTRPQSTTQQRRGALK